MKYGLREDTINRMQEVFASFPAVEKVVLYGSRAKGNYKDGSDIDLTLFGENLSSSLLNKVSLQLDDLYLPYMIDLSVHKQLDNKELLAHISRVGIEFYAANKEYKNVLLNKI